MSTKRKKVSLRLSFEDNLESFILKFQIIYNLPNIFYNLVNFRPFNNNSIFYNNKY